MATGSRAPTVSGKGVVDGVPARLRRVGRRAGQARSPFLGLVFAAVLLGASLTPSLLPRSGLVQAAVGGITAAIGYGLGTLVSHLWRTLPLPEPRFETRLLAWGLLALGAPAGLVTMLVRGIGWQRELHRLMDLPPPTGWGLAGGVLLAVGLAWALVLLARGLRLAGRTVGRWLSRRLPPRLAGPLGGILVAALVWGLLDGVVIDWLFTAADESFRLGDELVADEEVPPDSPARSGSPASRVGFDELGAQGRDFVTGGPARGSDGQPLAVEPIRVYAGLESAPETADRARLVVEELERTGAFDRAVLCVMTATGTGWVDPDAAAGLELLWDGDTALAAYQYSYLPSWLSFLVDAGRGRAAGAELFDAVHARWARLPEDERPLLLVFGESLGADGMEAAFSGVADLRNRTDGALFVGPPNFSELWSTLTRRRDAGSLERLPVSSDGRTVRFAARPADLQVPEGPWERPRVVYLQHASDPVVWWSPRLLLRRPDWATEPRGADVHPTVRWYPVVTFWQLTGDLLLAEDVPPGHGHDYDATVADAWAAIAGPPDWGPADTRRLRARLEATPPRLTPAAGTEEGP